MKRYQVILTESEMKKLKDSEYITVDYINRKNYKKYIGKKVNVIGDVELRELKLGTLPIIFGKVNGDFLCSNCGLTSLKGCPEKVGKDFSCFRNAVTSLEGCPSEVGRDFDCSHNKLTSLEGCPRKVHGSFDCSENDLTSLKGCPIKVDGDFDCRYNEREFTEENVEDNCEIDGDIYI